MYERLCAWRRGGPPQSEFQRHGPRPMRQGHGPWPKAQLPTMLRIIFQKISLSLRCTLFYENIKVADRNSLQYAEARTKGNDNHQIDITFKLILSQLVGGVWLDSYQTVKNTLLPAWVVQTYTICSGRHTFMFCFCSHLEGGPAHLSCACMAEKRNLLWDPRINAGHQT